MGEQGHKHGFFGWNQLLTAEPAQAAAFYQALLGWSARPGEVEGLEQQLMYNGDQPVASILGVPPEAGEAMPHWHPHLTVDDVDRRVELAGELGAKVVVQPGDIPGLGRLAVIQDPTGAVLTLVSPLSETAVPDAVDIDGD
jgi:predicted enzyme related to lactoylglutathione lyase